MMFMKLLITGGAGFMGSAFVRRIGGTFPTIVVDKLTYSGDPSRLSEVMQDIVFYEADVTDRMSISQILEEHSPDTIVHFASETHVDRSILDPKPFVETNILGTFNLLLSALEYDVKLFIHISTDEVYGSTENGSFKENSPLEPSSPYSATKASSDMLVLSFYRTYGLPAIIVRASNNYGPWQYPEKLIPLTILKALTNSRIPIYGNGRNVRSWLFVEDFVDALLTIMEKGDVGEIYNVGSRNELENIKVVRMILELLGSSEELLEFVPDRPGHDFRYSVDTTKLEGLGWKEKHSFEEGLSKTVSWYVENKDWLLSKFKEVEAFVMKLRREYARFDNRRRRTVSKSTDG